MSPHPPLLKLGPADHGRAVSADEFAHADFAEPWTFEREAGRLVVMSPEGQRHHDDSRPWRHRLHRDWLDHPEVVEDWLVGAWVRPDDGTDRIGDIGLYLVNDGPTLPIPDRVPDLMFEIGGPGRVSRERDYLKKSAEYRRLGIREYVIIDGKDHTVTVLRLGARGYRRCALQPADTDTSPLLLGLAIPLAEVL